MSATEPGVHQLDPDHVWPRVSLSTGDLAHLAGLLIGAQEYLEAVQRVARAEGRAGPVNQLTTLRLARDTVLALADGFEGSAKDCRCHKIEGTIMRSSTICPIHERPRR